MNESKGRSLFIRRGGGGGGGGGFVGGGGKKYGLKGVVKRKKIGFKTEGSSFKFCSDVICNNANSLTECQNQDF